MVPRIDSIQKMTHVYILGNTKPRPKCGHIMFPSKTKIKYANQHLRYACKAQSSRQKRRYNRKQRCTTTEFSCSIKTYHIKIYHTILVVLFRFDVSPVSKRDSNNMKTPNIFIMHRILQNIQIVSQMRITLYY